MKQLFSLVIVSFLLIAQLAAQANVGQVNSALSEFMHTDFMRKFNDLRVQAETEVAAFRANSAQYNPQDVARVQVAYDQTAQRFNGLLAKIKMDFLDRQKLKYITEYPETYSRGLELDIRELSDFYSQNLQQTLADVTNNQQDGSAMLILIFDLVKFSSAAIQHFKRIRSESRHYTDDFLNKQFLQPNHFKSWAEMGNGGYNNPYQNPSSPYSDPYSNPYQQNTTDPYNNTYNNPYQQTTSDPYSNPYQQTTTDPYNNTYNNTYNNPYQQTTSDPYSNPYQQNTTDPYNNTYNNPYQQTTSDPYSNPYQQNTTDPYNNTYNNPYQQTTSDPYSNPYQQNTTDPYNSAYQQSSNYGYDGSQPVDSLKRYWPQQAPQPAPQNGTLYIPKKVVKDSSKVKKTKQE